MRAGGPCTPAHSSISSPHCIQLACRWEPHLCHSVDAAGMGRALAAAGAGQAEAGGGGGDAAAGTQPGPLLCQAIPCSAAHAGEGALRNQANSLVWREGGRWVAGRLQLIPAKISSALLTSWPGLGCCLLACAG